MDRNSQKRIRTSRNDTHGPQRKLPKSGQMPPYINENQANELLFSEYPGHSLLTKECLPDDENMAPKLFPSGQMYSFNAERNTTPKRAKRTKKNKLPFYNGMNLGPQIPLPPLMFTSSESEQDSDIDMDPDTKPACRMMNQMNLSSPTPSFSFSTTSDSDLSLSDFPDEYLTPIYPFQHHIMEPEPVQSYIELPGEVWFNILLQVECTCDDLWKLRRVCKTWNTIISKKSFKKERLKLCFRLDPERETLKHMLLNESRHQHQIIDYLGITTGNVHQTEISAKMRAILVDWLFEVITEFDLAPDLLFTSVFFMDKFLSVTPSTVPRGKLQLVGVAAFRIASKLDEIIDSVPPVDDIVYICDRAYTRDEVRSEGTSDYRRFLTWRRLSQ
jgi:hypothetical protein